MKNTESETFDNGETVLLPPAPAILRDALRIATDEVHERLHHHIAFAAVQAGTIDHRAYIKLLSRLYGFYRPFEAAAQLSPERTRWLEIDLAALGISAAVREKLPRCTFPQLFSPDHILGARYVVEGSALGGRGMARHLDALLGGGGDRWPTVLQRSWGSDGCCVAGISRALVGGAKFGATSHRDHRRSK